MGLLFSRFRKKKTTIQVLDDIDQNGMECSLPKYSFYVFICTSTILLLVELNFEANSESIGLASIIMSRKILSWYYRRKLAKNETTLKTLKKKKVEILDEVSETEKYKQAREIFEKYAPERLNLNLGKSLPSNGNPKTLALQTQTPQTARQRVTQSGLPRKMDVSPSTPGSKLAGEVVPYYSGVAQPKLSLPRPVLPRDRGPFDKLVDMIIGDGPGNRYALICRVCSAHNGMALKHEFEYIAFRCAYCMQWNPARKQKPQAPHLALENMSHEESDANNSEPETIEYANLVTESERRNGDIEGKSESSSEEETNESGVSLETLELKENSLSDCVEGKTENVDTQIAPASDDIDLSDVRKALDDLEPDTAPLENAEHSKNTPPDASIEGDTR